MRSLPHPTSVCRFLDRIKTFLALIVVNSTRTQDRGPKSLNHRVAISFAGYKLVVSSSALTGSHHSFAGGRGIYEAHSSSFRSHAPQPNRCAAPSLGTYFVSQPDSTLVFQHHDRICHWIRCVRASAAAFRRSHSNATTAHLIGIRRSDVAASSRTSCRHGLHSSTHSL